MEKLPRNLEGRRIRVVDGWIAVLEQPIKNNDEGIYYEVFRINPASVARIVWTEPLYYRGF